MLLRFFCVCRAQASGAEALVVVVAVAVAAVAGGKATEVVLWLCRVCLFPQECLFPRVPCLQGLDLLSSSESQRVGLSAVAPIQC